MPALGYKIPELFSDSIHYRIYYQSMSQVHPSLQYTILLLRRYSEISQEPPQTFLPPPFCFPIICQCIRERTNNIDHRIVMCNDCQYVLMRIKITHLHNAIPCRVDVMRGRLTDHQEWLSKRRR